jgi:hypothetical protein
MYVLIMCHPDGDRYQLSNNLDVLKARFETEKAEGSLGDPYSRLVIADVEPDTDFGFGAYGAGGDFFGGEIIWDYEETFDK